MCNGDYDRRLKFVCMCRSTHKNNYVGEFHTTLKEIKDKHDQLIDTNKLASFECVNDKKVNYCI